VDENGNSAVSATDDIKSAGNPGFSNSFKVQNDKKRVKASQSFREDHKDQFYSQNGLKQRSQLG
jgi:hypothetical protein